MLSSYDQLTGSIFRLEIYETARFLFLISASSLPSSGAQFSQQVQPANQQKNAVGQERFSKEELELIAQLKARDREVRAHEQAHLAAAGAYAKGGVQYTYQRGPDGKNYAVGGEVQIDTSPIAGDPEATLRKAEQIRRAANAPAQPSSTDRAVAAEAAAMATQARIELAREQQSDEDGNQSNNRITLNSDLLSNTYATQNRPSNLIDEFF